MSNYNPENLKLMTRGELFPILDTMQSRCSQVNNGAIGEHCRVSAVFASEEMRNAEYFRAVKLFAVTSDPHRVCRHIGHVSGGKWRLEIVGIPSMYGLPCGHNWIQIFSEEKSIIPPSLLLRTPEEKRRDDFNRMASAVSERVERLQVTFRRQIIKQSWSSEDRISRGFYRSNEYSPVHRVHMGSGEQHSWIDSRIGDELDDIFKLIESA